MIREILVFTFEKLFLSGVQNIDRLLVCIPSEITSTERAALVKLGQELGVDDTRIEEEIKAAAIGGGIDIFTPAGYLVVDIGGGTTDYGVLSLGDVVVGRSTKIAGDHFDKQIMDYVKENYKLEIGPQTAEKIKISLSSLTGDLPVDEEGNVLNYSAMGRDLVSGLPRMAVIQAHEVREILLNCFETIRAVLISTLENTPPELSGDLVDNGILITGGGANIKGIEEYFEDIVHVNVTVSPNASHAVIDGTKKLLKIQRRHYFGEYY
jgi:rod shape-determining protein MreB